MTLPFRRRHNDAEASHDRARALISTGFVEPLGEAETTWLENHLGGCPECRTERDAYAADRALLRGLREHMPEPPRDLWARTASAIENRTPRRSLLAPSRFPVAALSAALVVLVVVGTTLLTNNGAIPSQPRASGSPVAHVSTQPGETPLTVTTAERLAWLQAGTDGSFALVFGIVDHACHAKADPECAPLADSSPEPLRLAAPPQAVVLAPDSHQVAVVGSAAETTGSVMIVDVPTPRPSGSALPSVPPSTIPTTPAASESAVPEVGHVIVRGVVVVGSVAYSPDGEWLAFSARPRDGSRGADLYVWHAGDAEATKITDDGATYFSGWYGNQIVASRVRVVTLVDGASPAPTGGSPTPDDRTASPPPSAAPSDASPSPSEEPGPVVAPAVGTPESFLLDPVTGERARFRDLNIWMPSIDPTGRFVTYWSGSLVPTDPTAAMPAAAETVTAWRPATGDLVLDGWRSPLTPTTASDGPSVAPTTATLPDASTSDGIATGAPGAEPTDDDLDAAASSPPPSMPADGGPDARAEGPAGTPLVLAPGPIADFEARFDPTGGRLAVWVLDSADASAGRLWLVILDPETGAVDPTLNPMGAPGVQAKRGFSIERGRLGWVTPEGQDGQPNSVQVLAWQGDDFGKVESLPGGSLQIVR